MQVYMVMVESPPGIEPLTWPFTGPDSDLRAEQKAAGLAKDGAKVRVFRGVEQEVEIVRGQITVNIKGDAK